MLCWHLRKGNLECYYNKRKPVKNDLQNITLSKQSCCLELRVRGMCNGKSQALGVLSRHLRVTP